MEPREYLRTDGESGERFRIRALEAAGRTFQVVRCIDTKVGDRPVCAKAPLDEAYEGEAVQNDRRRAARFEVDVLSDELEGLPGAVEFLAIDREEGPAAPVVVTDWIEGTSAFDYVAKRPREVLDHGDLLAIVREVGGRLSEIHDRGYLFRDLDPRHVLLDADGAFEGLVGTANITRVQEPPIRPSSDYVDAPYVAPEARQERSGATMRRDADVYGLAALLAYLLTGEEPTAAVESPLTGRGYEQLEHIDPPGLRNLVAAGLQPVAKNRVSLATFLRHARLGALPGADDESLESGETVEPLPPPWSGAEPPGQNRAARSSLSPGPLISVNREVDDSGPAPGESPEFSGVKSEPVREFLGERNEVGEEFERGEATEDEDSGEVRRRTDGAPVREVNMVEENIASETEAKRAGVDPSGLPDLSDLPLRTRLLVGVAFPLAVLAVVAVVGYFTV